MSRLLKSVLSIAIVGAVSTSAMAADGTINFTGEITAASCTITGNTGTNVGGSAGKQTIDLNLGKVSTSSLGNTTNGIGAAKNIRLNLDCGTTATGLTTVKLLFDPSSGSGIDSKHGSLLKTSGTATGVGIGLYNSKNELLNLSANETINGDLVKTEDAGPPAKTTYSANLDLRAGYVLNGATVAVGTANGTLPFTLTYE
ncbi:type 1 fimbrial protein [Pseudomonas chlororaphis]|uniref:fimbrial protein n=1 Tax=Pseudomonas chlororaphis TaxID=587753 RepID=UPI001E3D27E2|nr:fimbrial protein [Pseudomonas chlororaphis]MCB2256657.1 type 1 fimbrial protein [Pseudomonas chlororaphis]